MSMITILVCLLFGSEPIRVIEVENQGRFIPDVAYGKVQLTGDGGFLINNFHHIWHWNGEGGLINFFGGRGEGPGEFIGLSEVLWTGSYYWAMDGYKGLSSIFDRNGDYLFRKATRYRQFIPVDGRLFVVDYSKLNPFVKAYPAMVREISYWIDNERLEITNLDAPFRKATPRQVELELNFKKVWLIHEGDRLLVVDELEPKIWIYDQQTRSQERALESGQVFEPDFMALVLPGWVEPPAKIRRDLPNYKSQLTWWHSWSRINYFGRIESDFFIAFEIPNPEDPASSLQSVQRLSAAGKPIGAPLIISGKLMGARDGQIYVFEEDEREPSFSYRILGYSL